MQIEPRSAALEEKFRSGENGAEVSLILAQSPDVSEKDAEENRAWRQKLSEKLKQRAAEKEERGARSPERS